MIHVFPEREQFPGVSEGDKRRPTSSTPSQQEKNHNYDYQKAEKTTGPDPPATVI